jgi:hypothetical protein
MAYTKLQACNVALRILGAKPITAANLTAEDTEEARQINDVYDLILDEVLTAHPWNFAIQRASLTELGGQVSTWTASGTTNVWQAALTTEPARVEFDSTEGTVKASVAACTAEGYWYWASNVLYVYSASDPDTAYTKIEALIPEYGYDHAYQLPTDCLRVIRMEDDEADFVREADRLFTDEETAKIQYIKQVTDPTYYTPFFMTALAQRLAAEIAFPLTNSATLAEVQYKIYLDKLSKAKAVDSQEGSGQEINISKWQDARG